MRASKARAGTKLGEPGHRRWSAYGKQQGKEEMFIALHHHIASICSRGVLNLGKCCTG